MSAAAPLRGARQSLLRWYRRNRRDLPWRRTTDPYAIWVSEVMLQQTRVTTVLPYYDRFLRRFPDPSSLADASADEVLSLWSGLGYYRRARALHAGAQTVVREHGGRVPSDPDELRRLPGIGRYTAGAIASVAFGRPAPVVDGNVRRVLSRAFAIDSDRDCWTVAGRLVEGASPGDLNQALMELGATLCLPRKPLCGKCPLTRRCIARQSGRTDSVPAPGPRAKIHESGVAVAWIFRAGRLLLERPDSSNPFRGTWDLPAIDTQADGRALALRLARRHGLEIRVGEIAARATHGIMNRRLRLSLYRCRLLRGRVAGRDDLVWLDPSRIPETPVSGATLKLARAILSHPQSGQGPLQPASSSTVSGSGRSIGPRNR